MSEILNEELAYMKYLLGYKKGIVISEQEVSKQNTNKSTQPKNNTNKSDDGCEKILTSGKFRVTKADSTEYKDNIIAELERQIESNPIFANGGTVTNLRIIGGASNVLNRKATKYSMDNNYKIINDPNKITDASFKENLNYAKNRVNAAKQPIIDELEKLNLTIQGDPKIEYHIINTNGKSDEENKGGKPGQVVIVDAIICPLKKEGTTASLEKISRITPKKADKLSKNYSHINLTTIPAFKPLYECYKSLTLNIDYLGSGHSCQRAVWDVFANDIPLSRESRWGKVSFASLNNVCDNYDNNGTGEDCSEKSGNRYNEFKLDEITAKQFLNAESVRTYKGELQISMKCQVGSKGTLNIDGHPTSGGGCHKGITTIKVTTNEGEEEDQTKNTPATSGEKKVVHTVSACKGIYNRIVNNAGGSFEAAMVIKNQSEDNKKKLFRRNK